MNISVFLSYPNPYLERQKQFIQRLEDYLTERGFSPRTLGVTDYDVDAPLKAIRRLMLESNGLITVAFRRALVTAGESRPATDLPGLRTASIAGSWLTSPYCQIEPAMAYQIGLPVLIFREAGVIADGILEKGVLGTYMPEFDLDRPLDDYFRSRELREMLGKWEGFTRAVVETKGNPPKLY